MAEYYDALIAAWNGTTQPPTGVTGSGLLSTDTTAQKVVKVNGWIVAVPQKAILTGTQIVNAIVATDLAALTALQIAQLQLLILDAGVDCSKGTSVRTAIQNMFAGKTQTLQQLAALVAPFDNYTETWCQNNQYPYNNLTLGGLTTDDAKNAGLV
jgi:hypothetical protein